MTSQPQRRSITKKRAEYMRGLPPEKVRDIVQHFMNIGPPPDRNFPPPDGLCVKCRQPRSPEGYDPCMGKISGAVFACCGHGKPGKGYVKFTFGPILRWQSEIQRCVERDMLDMVTCCRCYSA